ncbi:MAG TPA: DUF1643 domain-containing protein [Beijerinckiaceae bacterium]|nr:DUF1643 domain-containing protein [Beijerinckiaceae bacterium]
MPVTRRFRKGDADSEALYSPCGAYRYLLTRRWGEGGLLLYVMLNPSTATEERNDPTIERCERRARMLRHGGLAVANLFGFRATYPADLRAAPDPVGPENDAVLMQAAANHDRSGRSAALSLPGRWPVPKFLITGADVMASGVTRGPEVGRRLAEIEARWIAAGMPEGREAQTALLSGFKAP